MTAAGCPYPDMCPVPSPTDTDLRRVRTIRWPARTTLWRGHRKDHGADRLVPGSGDTRFAPLPGADHAYVSASRTAGLLESVLHDASGPAPRIRMATLARWELSPVSTSAEVRLIDLRDPALERLALRRDELVDTLPAHYPCTREWATALHARHVGGRATHGLVWHSRQADLHARSGRSEMLADLLVHRSVEVGVLWHPPADAHVLAAAAAPEPLDTGAGLQLVRELASLLGIPIM